MNTAPSTSLPARISPSDIELPPTQPIQIIGWLTDGNRSPSLDLVS